MTARLVVRSRVEGRLESDMVRAIRSLRMVFWSCHRPAFAALLCALALGASACGHAPIGPPIGPEVVALKFSGNHAFSDGELRQKIITERTGWWPFSEVRRFDAVVFATDMKRLQRLYHAQGFHLVQVRATTTPRGRDRVELSVAINEGARSRVDKVTFIGLPALLPELRLPLREGMPFSEDLWQADKSALESALRARGYALAMVTGRALVYVDESRVELELTSAAGPLCHYGRTIVEQGRPPHISERFVEEQVGLALKPGDVVTPVATAAAQKRVFALGVFSGVDVTTAEDVAPATLNVVARTQTAPFRTLRLGGGGLVDQVRNELRLRGGWSHANFLGGLRKLTLESRVGWAFLPGFLTFLSDREAAGRNGAIYSATATFEQPRFLQRPSLRFLGHAESERLFEEAFTAVSGRSGPDLAWSPRTDLVLSAGYELYGARLVTVGTVDYRDAPLAIGCSTNPCVTWLSFVRQRAVWDRRDDALSPSRGTYLSLELIEGGGPLGGSFTYVRGLVDGRAYATVGKLTASVRAAYGGLSSLSGNPLDTPIEHRFFAGGATSMRGFGSRRLSPMVGIDDDARNIVDTLPIGGSGLLLGSFELRWRLRPLLALASFWDSGLVTRDVATTSDVRHLFHAVGGGVRFYTPVGAVRIDVARRLQVGGPRSAFVRNEVQYPAESTSCFGFGGTDGPLHDGLCALHLSIGEAF